MKKILVLLFLAYIDLSTLTVDKVTWAREADGKTLAVTVGLHNYGQRETKSHRVMLELADANGKVVAVSQQVMRDHLLPERSREWKLHVSVGPDAYANAATIKATVVGADEGGL